MWQAQQEVSSLEFTEWMAFFELEPFGDEIADFRHGVSSALLANVNRSEAHRPKPYRMEDFIFWRRSGDEAAEAEPVLLADPVEQSRLMRAAIFGVVS